MIFSLPARSVLCEVPNGEPQVGFVFALLASAVTVLGLGLPSAARAAGPSVAFTLPAQNSTPAAFGALPYPNDLYFDQGRPGDGDGTLINTGLPPGGKIGLASAVITANTAAVEEALDRLDGFGTTTAVYFFFSGPLDAASLPASPVTAPALTDGVFCADTATLTPVPIALKSNADSRIPNVLAIAPLPGRPLAAATRYTCVVRGSVTGGGDPVEPDVDWASVRDGTSANTDADAIFDPVVTALATAGVPTSAIAGMTVFTTQSIADDLLRIRNVVLPGLATPTADFTSRPQLVFNTDTDLAVLLSSTPHGNLAQVATGFYGSPRFQTADPDGDGPLADLPTPPSFVSCATPCETTDEAFVRDGSGNPIVQSTPAIPFTVVVPKGVPPVNGWPVVIVQHGLGGQRETVVRSAEALAARGFASIGIDAVGHGYRYFGCTSAASCSQDTANAFGGLGVPDGFVDGTFLGYDLGTVTFGLGFLEALHNFVAVRDNLRQTYVDLFSLVRLLQGHSIDSALNTQLNAGNLFFMGHQLGGIVGTGFVAVEANVRAALVSGAGGYLATELFNNSPSGLGELGLADGVLGLDPANVADAFSLPFNLVQQVLEPADPANLAHLLLAPANGLPRSMILVEGMGDEFVPNQATEALALAAGYPLFDPFVKNLLHSPLVLPVVSPPRFIRGNVGGGLATAAVLQTAAAHDAAVGGPLPGVLTLVPGFAHWEEFPTTGEALPTLLRDIPVGTTGILQAVLDWFGDIAASGPPGTFTLDHQPTYSPTENVTIPAGAFTKRFFDRTVGVGGGLSVSEVTPDVVVDFGANTVATRLTVARSTLGSGPLATDADMPPGPTSTVGTLGFLPFFVTVQRELPGTFSATLTISYSATELGVAGIPAGTTDETALVIARFSPGVCVVGAATCSEHADCGTSGPCLGSSYTVLPSTADAGLRTVTTSGVTDFSTYVVLHPAALVSEGYIPPLVPGGPGAISDCRAEFKIANPTNVPFRDNVGRVHGVQNCRDGDVTCDADRTINGTCTFRVGVCFNHLDPLLPNCTVGVDGITLYQLTKPKPLARDPVQAGNAQRLRDAMVALGGSVSGIKENLVIFGPPLLQRVCTELVPVNVRHKPTNFGSLTVRGMSRFVSNALDVGGDKLRLRCYPAF